MLLKFVTVVLYTYHNADILFGHFPFLFMDKISLCDASDSGSVSKYKLELIGPPSVYDPISND